MATNKDSKLFSSMNGRNLTKSEMDQSRRVKKRKINEISTSSVNEDMELKPLKEEEENQTNVKECAFNPFGNDSCDMCGS